MTGMLLRNCMKFLYEGLIMRRITNKIKENKTILENLSYMTFLQIFLLVYPLITYPYLVRVLGKELYGVVLTAQMLASYASLLIDFGSNFVCAKHVSINRDNKLMPSVILSNVLFVRFIIFLIIFIIYAAIAYFVSAYKPYFWLFVLTYGFTTNDLLFPQFFFQGIEKMKFITLVSISTKVVMVALIFLLVKSKEEVLFVPIIYSFGFLIGGIISLFIIYRMGIRMVKPRIKDSLFYLKDSSSIFLTDVVCSIKDKLSYLMVGTLVGMSDVVIYDLGQKLHGIAAKPYTLICTVLFPRFAKDRDLSLLKRVALLNFSVTLTVVIVANVFLDDISYFFIHEHTNLLPLRLFLLGPIVLSVSYVLSNNLFVAFGYNRYMFYSILATTVIYFISLAIALFYGCLNNIMSFVCIALISYVAELIYRLYLSRNIYKNENLRKIDNGQ